MCCDNKCLFFIEVRKGSLIFGYTAAIITAIGVLVSTGLLFGFAVVLSSGHGFNMNIAPLFFVQTCFFLSTAGFTCNVLLLCGITKNKPVLVKTYIIYGMIKFVLLLVTVIIFFSTYLFILGALGILICGIYALIIYMIYLTYNIMVTESANTNTAKTLLSAPY